MNIQDDRALARLGREDNLLGAAIQLTEALRLLGCDCPVDDLVRHSGGHAGRCQAAAKDARIAQLEHD